MTDDAELLRRYAEERSETAFAELVQRHLDLVYAAALRRLGSDAHRAADVAQSVFISLARHAASLSRRPVLVSWLYTTTRHAAIDVIRTESRRHSREELAHAMNDANSAPTADWEQLRPILDTAMDQLDERDREIVLLRFFENRSFTEVGTQLALTEDAARMRATRALEKLRGLLARHGVTSTATALSTALVSQTVVAAPSGLAALVTNASAVAGTTALTAGVLSFMSTTKTLLAVAGLVTAAGIGSAVYEARVAQRSALAAIDLQRERDTLRTQSAALEARLNETSANLVRATALQKETEEKLAEASVPPKIPAAPAANSLWANPDYGRGYVAKERASLGLRFSQLYRELRLSPEQISKFEDAQTELWQGIVDIWSETTAQGFSTNNDTSVARLTKEPYKVLETNLRALLGDSGFDQYQQYQKETTTRELVTTLAGSLYFTETPLTAERGNQLAQILKANTATKKIPMRDDGKEPLYSLVDETDWTAVHAQARSLLSTPQLAALKMLGEQKRLEAELEHISR